MISCVQSGNVYEFRGLSTDTKPEDATNGSVFFEADTKKAYMFDKENNQWREI